jgi:hypothetical protein
MISRNQPRLTRACVRTAVALVYAQFTDAVDGAGPESAKLYQRAYALNPQDPNAAGGLALHLHHFSSETHRTVCSLAPIARSLEAWLEPGMQLDAVACDMWQLHLFRLHLLVMLHVCNNCRLDGMGVRGECVCVRVCVLCILKRVMGCSMLTQALTYKAALALAPEDTNLLANYALFKVVCWHALYPALMCTCEIRSKIRR